MKNVLINFGKKLWKTKFVNNLCLSGAWIFDRNNHKFPRDRGSLTKKIRKALGYTFL